MTDERTEVRQFAEPLPHRTLHRVALPVFCSLQHTPHACHVLVWKTLGEIALYSRPLTCLISTFSPCKAGATAMMKSFLIGLLALRWPTVSKRDVAGPASNVAPVCRQYNVLSNDTCLAICSKSKVTYAQLLSWNPSLNPQCSYVYGSQWLDRANDVQSNLDALDGGHLCISNPVANGSYIISSNTHGLTSIATTTA